MYDKQLIKDNEVAITLNCIFEIATKTGKGKPWIALYSDIDNLLSAYDIANQLDAYEVAIFYKGFMYWKSKFPIFNSTIFE